MIDLSPLDRHEHVAACISGGKDSTAVVYLLRSYWDRICFYFVDTGDLFPEMTAVVDHIEAMVPRLVRVRTDVAGWISANGLPTDLLPHSQHWLGRAMGEGVGTRLVLRHDCCRANIMQPLYERLVADGITLMIRGTKTVDLRFLPARSGQWSEDGIEIWHPIEDWSHAQVMAYLREVGAPISRVYDTAVDAPDCMRCSGHWGERRATYLKEHYPEAFADYAARMRLVWAELAEPVRTLAHEWEALGA